MSDGFLAGTLFGIAATLFVMEALVRPTQRIIRSHLAWRAEQARMSNRLEEES